MSKPLVVISIGDDGIVINSSNDVDIKVFNYVKLDGDREAADIEYDNLTKTRPIVHEIDRMLIQAY